MHDLFSLMVEKSGKEKPKVAIIGAVPLEKDERVEAFQKAGAGEVVCLIITEANADSQEIYDALSSANIIFIRGGDQGRYVNWWRGKKTEAAIRAVFAKGGVISGSSAGCAIMGEWTYDAVKDGLSPRDALRDARHENLTITHGFLGLVPNVLFDTHFTERGRLPRTVVMLARIADVRKNGFKPTDIRGLSISEQSQLNDRALAIEATMNGNVAPSIDFFSPLGIGVDPRTAVCVGPDGIAVVKGEGMATLLKLSYTSKVVSVAGKPPSVTNVRYSLLLPETTFSTKTGEIISVPGGVTKASPVPTAPAPKIAAFTIDGGKADDAKVGSLVIANAERREAERKEDAGDARADASIIEGLNKVPCLVTTLAWSKRHPQWVFAMSQKALATRPGSMALFLDEGCRVDVDEKGAFHVMGEGKTPMSLVVLDARRAAHVGTQDARPPRSHIDGAVVHIVAPGQVFDPTTGEVRE
jgi:cyanophycinase-like exopeptidase